MNKPPDKPYYTPEDRLAAMEGAGGAELQFQMLQARTQELIDQAFDFFSFVPGSGVTVKGSNKEPYLQLRD